MARRKSHPEEDSAAPAFEDALAGLEAIVEAMEHEPLPLEELVDAYQQGSALLDRCEALLQAARGRIELITLRNLHPIDPLPETATDPSPAPSLTPSPPDASDDDSDDIRLF